MERLIRIFVLVSVLLTAATASGAVEYEAVILHPSGFKRSEAYGVCGGQQVGEGWYTDWRTEGHALLWAGTGDTGKNQRMGNADFMSIYCGLWRNH